MRVRGANRIDVDRQITIFNQQIDSGKKRVNSGIAQNTKYRTLSRGKMTEQRAILTRRQLTDRRKPTQRITLGRFNLDHLSTGVSKELPEQRSGNSRTALDNAKVIEWTNPRF